MQDAGLMLPERGQGVQSPKGGPVVSRWTTLFWLVIVAGITLRILAGTQSLGFANPDEHQQYLEAAQGIVHGYCVTYWEYERGIRHYLYPGLLAGAIFLFELCGLSDPVLQAIAIRTLLGVFVLLSIVPVAHDWLRRGRLPAALCLITMAAFSPDMIFIGARTLSETAMIVPLMLGLYFFERRPAVAGALFGVMFAIRFQSAILIAGFALVSAFDAWKANAKGAWRSTVKLAAGLAISLLCMGLIDKLTWGAWFQSPVEYFQANILEGIASHFSPGPWHRYLHWIWHGFLQASPLLFALLAVGMAGNRRLAFVVLLFLLVHMLISNKQSRFLWPALPLALVLMAEGFETFYYWLGGQKGTVPFSLTRKLGQSPNRAKCIGVGLLACWLLVGAGIRFAQTDWVLEPMKSNSIALARIGRMPDVTGVAVYGLPDYACGNYFYLRRNVPYLAKDEYQQQAVFGDQRWKDGTINYLLTRPSDVALFEKWRPEEVDRVGEWGIYKLKKPGEGGKAGVGGG
jgi:hypothetical protein